MAESTAPLRTAGGKPVMADPGKIPILPVTTVPKTPVLVTVEPARMA